MTRISFCQNNFIGKYTDIYRDDTIPGQHSEAVYYTTINIQKNNKFTYCYQLNATGPKKELQETVVGNWKLSGDTIILNHQSEQKEPTIKYLEGFDKNEITIIATNSKGKQIKLGANSVDSLSKHEKRIFVSIPYKQKNNKKIVITDSTYIAIYLNPKGYCKDFAGCFIKVNLENIKKGTQIVVTYYNTELENKVNNTKYILRDDILHELPKTKDIPDNWINNFKKITLPNSTSSNADTKHLQTQGRSAMVIFILQMSKKLSFIISVSVDVAMYSLLVT